jgi:anti-sigma-K factor RskA
MLPCKLESESLTEYLLGTLEDSDKQLVAQHLATGCETCQTTLAQLRETLALIAYSVPLASPAPALKSQLMAQITAKPVIVPLPLPTVSFWQKSWVKNSLRIAASLLVLTGLGTQATYLWKYRQLVNQQAEVIDKLTAQVDQKEHIISSMSTSRKLVVLEGNLIKASGRAFWDTDQNTWLFHIEKLPPAPKGKTYQVWFITETEAVSGGVFQTDARGSAKVPLKAPIKNEPIVGTAISLEPEGGSQKPQGAVYLSASM